LQAQTEGWLQVTQIANALQVFVYCWAAGDTCNAFVMYQQ
jgi:hypothetical protein